MADSVELPVVAGLPFSRNIRVVNGGALWASTDDFEVRSHIRAGKTEASPLLFNLSPYFTASIEGDDIVLHLEMTGAQTRSLVKGYYDVIVSDLGTTDARAFTALSGKVKISSLITAVDDE